ncbi:hypothetical protein IM793_12905 [Pedobacter sp. MR2016-19]|nr:hypothetical protein [Pedobacter sp. MR2016-19]MBE5320065.1 hypothetical protein [Pedobacter sp. MR2016-19]
MNLSNIQTPGVYINELNAFPNSVVSIATAVPVSEDLLVIEPGISCSVS